MLHPPRFCFSDGLFRPRHGKTNKTKRLSPRSTSNRLSLRDSSNPRLRDSSSNISNSKARDSNSVSNSNKLRLHNSRSNNVSSNKLRDSNSVSNSNKLRLRNSRSNNVSSSRLRDNNSVNRRTTQRSSSSKPEGNRINNANSGNSRTTLQNKISSKLRGNTINNSNNSNNSVSSKTIPLGSSRPEDSRISNVSNVNSRTTDPHNSGARLRFISNRSLGKVIVPRVGSLSIAPGSNVVATTVTAFQMTGSVATMASLTSSASTASR